MYFRIDGTQVLQVRVDTQELTTEVSYGDDFQGAKLDPKEGVFLALDHHGRVSIKITGNALYQLLSAAGFLSEGPELETSKQVVAAGV
jgi:hypothetical protein